MDSGGDLAVGGGYTTLQPNSFGYLLRWNPAENRIVFSTRFDAPLGSIAAGMNTTLYFASAKFGRPGLPLTIGAVDGSGNQ